MKKLMFVLALACFGVAQAKVPEGWTDDYESALKRAAEEKSNVLVDFTGSDWSSWCKKLDKEVFATDVFRREAPKKYVLLYVDSPRDVSSLSEKARTQNTGLVEKYKVERFPTVVVLDAAGREITRTGYRKGGPEAYLKGLDDAVREAPDVEKYIKPIETVLNASDESMKKEMMAIEAELLAKLTNGVENLSAAEQRKAFKEMTRAMQENLFEKVLPKYIPLYDKAFAEAHAMEVPSHMEAKKKDLIDRQESNYRMMKAAYEAYQKKKADPAAEDEGDDEEDDEEEEDFCMVTRESGFKLPEPKDAKVDTDYYQTVAMPFWTKHVVDAYIAGEGVGEKDAEGVRQIRRALARYLTTADPKLPSGAELALATALWNRKNRDAAVAIFHYFNLDEDPKYWQGERILKESADKHDFSKDPVTGFVLRLIQLDQLRYRRGRCVKETPLKRIVNSEKTALESFRPVMEIFKSADPRIFERLGMMWNLPLEVIKLSGDDYLLACQLGDAGIEAAFESRGSGWARSVTEEGWKGYELGIKAAESNYLAAAKMRPEEARPAMGLARLYGCGCGSNGDAFAWFHRGVSNSLDSAALKAGGFIHFQTSRWGGSTRTLYDLAFACATNVDVRSEFSWRTAAYAIVEIFTAETDGSKRDGVIDRVLTPELTAALYAMFEQYAAAPACEFMPSADVFLGMGMSLALLKHDWDKVKEWRGRILAPNGVTRLANYNDAKFMMMINGSLQSPYYRYMNDILIRSRYAEDFIAAEKALDAKDLKEAFSIYERLNKIGRPSDGEKFIVGKRYFDIRTTLQEQEGGWVNLMPTERGGEAVVWWGFTLTEKDGRARIVRDRKSYYRVDRAFQGIGAEYEATIHFEKKDAKQKEWNIGFGLARVFSGYCFEDNSWAMPYVAFWRDEKGDHAEVESYTDENHDAKGNDTKIYELGRAPEYTVWSGGLEHRDDHSFRIRTTGGLLRIDIDGKEVYSVPLEEIRGLEDYGRRIQPDGKVQPIWKLFSNTSFSGYRYRMIKDDPAAEGRPNE